MKGVGSHLLPALSTAPEPSGPKELARLQELDPKTSGTELLLSFPQNGGGVGV